MRQCSRAENSKEISKSTKPREIIATVRKQKTELNNQLQPVHLQREGIPPYGIYHFKPKRRKKIIEGRIFLDLTPNSSNWNINQNETDSAEILSWTFNG